jgi:hypothetical protein
VGKEWLILEGSLVLAGILEEARAAWVAMAATKLKRATSWLYIVQLVLSVILILQFLDIFSNFF